jgi:hypothetical protein
VHQQAVKTLPRGKKKSKSATQLHCCCPKLSAQPSLPEANTLMKRIWCTQGLVAILQHTHKPMKPHHTATPPHQQKLRCSSSTVCQALHKEQHVYTLPQDCRQECKPPSPEEAALHQYGVSLITTYTKVLQTIRASLTPQTALTRRRCSAPAPLSVCSTPMHYKPSHTP